MNTKKVVIVAACAAVLVGSAFAFRKVKKEVTRILKAEEPKDDVFDSKAKISACDRNELRSACCETSGDCCEAMSPCDAAVPMGKARLVD